jgi:VWFA-related protein
MIAPSKSEAAKYLQTMPEGTQVILVDMSNTLHVLQGVTTDRRVLIAALHSAAYHPNVFVASGSCNFLNADDQLVVSGLENLAAYLSGIQGRKNLIWFTPGIPSLTDYPPFEGSCVRDFTPSLQRDYNLLAAAQVALYPIDPSGIHASLAGHFVPQDPRKHISMEDLADATGGRAYYDTNDLASAIGEAIAAGTDSYALSYVPPQPRYDGQYHKISVTVDRPAVRLVYRKGYTSIDPAETPQAGEKAPDNTPPAAEAALSAALSHGAVAATQVLFTVGVTPSVAAARPGDPVLGQLNPGLKLKGRTLVRYDFNYRVLPGDITLTDAPGGKREASVEFAVAAYDGTGEMLNVLQQTASFAVAPDKLAGFLERPFPVLLQLDLPSGDVFVRAAVRDVASGKTGSLEIPLTVAR